MLFYDLIRYFIIYAFLGWCIEVAYAAVKEGRFINRGFLNGPVCPIYGFGMLAVLMVLSRLKGSFFALFAGSVILTSLLEFVTGYVLEKIFNDKWWDYSDCRFNIKGYICLKFSIMWGIACVFAVCVIHPFVERLVGFIPKTVSIIVFSLFYALLVTDTVLTVIETAKIKKYFKNAQWLEGKLKGFSDAVGNEIAETVFKAEKLYENISERGKSANTSLKQYGLNIRERQEASAVYAKIKGYAKNKGYIYDRLSKAFPVYFDKNADRIRKLKKHVKRTKI